MFNLKNSLKFTLAIFLISVFILNIGVISATDVLNETVLENVDSYFVYESDFISVEKNNRDDVLSQNVENGNVNTNDSLNESILGETEIIDAPSQFDDTYSLHRQITTLTISGIKDYYYYGDIITFDVYHSHYYDGKPSSSYVAVLVDNDYPNHYGTVLQNGETRTLYLGNLNLGFHTISARYSDHASNLEEVNFYVLKNPVKFSKPTKTLKKSKNVKSFKITVKLANGKPLSKKYVYMKINGKTYKARTTSKGVVTFKFLLPKKTKTYSYKVKYYGEYGYSAKTYSGKLKVR